MWSPACAIFVSIVITLVEIEAVLNRFSVRINFTSKFESNYLLANIAVAGEHIFQVLGQYS